MTGTNRGVARGLKLLLALSLAGSALVGLPMRTDEMQPGSALDPLKRPQGFLPANVKAVWIRFVTSVERSRGTIPRPGVIDRENPPRKPDLGDGYLIGFARERGLRKKVLSLSGYLATLGRAHRWLVTLSEEQQQTLKLSFASLAREAQAAETILIRQVAEDMRRGGKAVDVLVDHVQRVGYAESTAQDAFGGLTSGLKRELTQIVQGGNLSDEEQQALTGSLTTLSRLVDGN